MFKYTAVGEGYFIDPETGELIAAEEMIQREKGEVNGNKDKSAGTKNAGADKATHGRQIKARV